jgi:Cu/Ag efflux protein CusF
MTGILPACLVAVAAGVATAVAIAPDPAALVPWCSESTAPARMVTAFGRVVRADLDKRYLTIGHDQIKSLSMPAMEMMFEAKSRGLLEPLKVKDRIRFTIDRGDMTITDIVVIERAR